MAEKNSQKIKTQSDYLSDSETSEDEVSPHLRTSQEERLYGTIKGSVQVTQVAVAHSTVHVTPWWNEDHQNSQKLRRSTKDRHQKKQPSPKRRTSHCDILTLFSNILFHIPEYICDII